MLLLSIKEGKRSSGVIFLCQNLLSTIIYRTLKYVNCVNFDPECFLGLPDFFILAKTLSLAQPEVYGQPAWCHHVTKPKYDGHEKTTTFITEKFCQVL